MLNLALGRLPMGERSRIHEAERHRASLRPHDLQQGRPLPVHQLDAAQRRREGPPADTTAAGPRERDRQVQNLDVVSHARSRHRRPDCLLAVSVDLQRSHVEVG